MLSQTGDMPAYEDLSPWAVHFTSPEKRSGAPVPRPSHERGGVGLASLLKHIKTSDPTGYSNAQSILGSGFIRPVKTPHGAAFNVPEVADRHRSASFSEIPLHLLARLVKHRSPYGVGFSQDFLRRHGGGKVIYLEEDGAQAKAMKELVRDASSEGVDPADPIWNLTPFVDFVDVTATSNDWRWEREWRVPGGLSFKPNDVAFLFLPEDLHEKARQFYANAEAENAGPGYFGTYIDVTWGQQRISDELRKVAPPKPKPTVGPSWRDFHDPRDFI